MDDKDVRKIEIKDETSPDKPLEDLKEIQTFAKHQIGEEFVDAEVKDKSEIISAKKVIYIEIDDEVTNVYDKIKNLKIKHIYIVAPKRAIIFQSIVNLKILKRKAEDSGKMIYLITNDSNGIYLAQQVGIPVYDKVSNEGKPVFFSIEEEDEKLRITPLKATVNSVIDETPVKRTERKLSISEILHESKNKGKALLHINKLSKKAPEPSLKQTLKQELKEEKIRKNRLVFVAPNKQALIGLGVVSLLILMIIFYIALPGVTVYLTPAASVLEQSTNIILADSLLNKAELDAKTPQMIGAQRITVKIDKSIPYISTGKKMSPNASNSSGNITIVNTTSNQWPLITETRFQTNEGLVFRIKSPVTVPAATKGGPGKIQAYVTADLKDAYGQVIGARGNIGPAKFFLPGLKESSRSQIYAESSTNMSGGLTDFITHVTEDDIKAANGKLKEALMKSAEDELKKDIALRNDVDGTDYVLLVGEQAITTGDVVFTPISDLADKELPQFNVSGNLTATGYAYSKSAMDGLLRQELLMKKSPQKKLVKIDETSITYRIFEKDSIKGRLKITANIKGIEENDLDPSKENGARLIEKIKEHILGKSIEEARSYIQNLPEINKVDIESWPAWSPTIPTVADNIDIEIVDVSTVEGL